MKLTLDIPDSSFSALRQPEGLDVLLREVVKRVCGVTDPVRIVLFGSAARGEAGSNSDLDVLVVVREGVHRRQTRQRLYQSLRGLGIPVDFVVATESDVINYGACTASVLEPALREGVELYAT